MYILYWFLSSEISLKLLKTIATNKTRPCLSMGIQHRVNMYDYLNTGHGNNKTFPKSHEVKRHVLCVITCVTNPFSHFGRCLISAET